MTGVMDGLIADGAMMMVDGPIAVDGVMSGMVVADMPSLIGDMADATIAADPTRASIFTHQHNRVV
jgi:hypothetical protein